MSRKYEGLLVLDTRGLEGSIDDLVKAISKEMEAEGAKVNEVKQNGHRHFAYPQKHIQGGHYVNFIFAAESDTLNKIEGRLKLNANVHLQHYTRLA